MDIDKKTSSTPAPIGVMVASYDDTRKHASELQYFGGTSRAY